MKRHKQKKPPNYWQLVSGRTFHIMDTKPGVSGEDAHKLALYQIDKELAARASQLELLQASEGKQL